MKHLGALFRSITARAAFSYALLAREKTTARSLVGIQSIFCDQATCASKSRIQAPAYE